ncbi:MAG: TonB-dependent receptor, partial [Candidatus Acidiferrales bacterium]
MRRFAVVLMILSFVTLFGYAISTFSQISVAQLNGTVLDESGGAVSKATITMREMDTNRSYTGVTNDSGFYALANLPPGRYELKVGFAGFSGYTQTGIVLTVGQVATINITLKVAARGEQVVVTGEVPVIEPGRTEISQVIDTQKIDSLPISGRLFTDFALLTPGVATSRTSLGTTFTEYEATQISFGGMRSFSNEITVDGADFVNTASGVQRSTPPQESVQEFRVVNNSFGAESGRALGGIVNIVTKSGTNDLHGSLYDYFQNSAFDARGALQPAPLPHELRQNQFGGTVGGPIKQNKTFFFANYEGKRRAESPTYPPALVDNLSLIDEAKALMGLAPEGCTTGLAQCTLSNQSYLNSFLKTGDNDYGFARFDHQINANNRLAVRYVAEDAREFGELVGQTLDGGGIGVPSGGRNLFIRDQSLVGTVDSSLRPNLVNTALFQYARRHYNFPGATGQPDFSILNDLELGHNFGTNDRLYESRVQASDSIAWVKGNHVAKFGFDGNYLWSLENFPGFMPVRTLMPGLECLANFAEFYNSNAAFGSGANLPTSPALDTAAGQCAVPQDNGIVFTYAGIEVPTDPNFTSGPPLVTSANPLDTATWANAFPPSLFNTFTKQINHGYWGFYAQDQWRITHKLTMNFGLRWDYESGLGLYVEPDYGGWQPRIGLAYSPDSKTVIRAGFGIFDDRYNLTFFFVPNTQKVVPGLLCNPSSTQIAPGVTCADAGIQAQVLPMVNAAQATQGYQLFGFPGVANGATQASDIAASIISSGGYTANPFTANLNFAGTCFANGACGDGAGGMDHHVSKIPYAEQASVEIDRQLWGGFTLDVGYLFVGAHRLVRGNNINVPCPLGTTDTNQAGNPTDPLGDWVPGKLNANGSFSTCATGGPTLGSGALAGVGPFFEGALGTGLQTLSAG